MKSKKLKVRELEQGALELINDREVRKRVKYLLENKTLGKSPIIEIEGTKYYSNCHGTSLFVLGRSYCELDFEPNSFGMPLQVSAEGRPGYVDEEAMKDLLGRRDIVGLDDFEDGEHGIFSILNEAGFLTHSGIYLGNLNGSRVVFHQPNSGKSFCVDYLEKVVKDFKLIINRLLKSESNVKFYRVDERIC
jgi:hypothetical protein